MRARQEEEGRGSSQLETDESVSEVGRVRRWEEEQGRSRKGGGTSICLQDMMRQMVQPPNRSRKMQRVTALRPMGPNAASPSDA